MVYNVNNNFINGIIFRVRYKLNGEEKENGTKKWVFCSIKTHRSIE